MKKKLIIGLTIQYILSIIIIIQGYITKKRNAYIVKKQSTIVKYKSKFYLFYLILGYYLLIFAIFITFMIFIGKINY
jgi:hypothetical protein